MIKLSFRFKQPRYFDFPFLYFDYNKSVIFAIILIINSIFRRMNKDISTSN